MIRGDELAGRNPARARGARPAILLSLALLLSAAGAEAQPLIFGNRFNFNFSNPGARSLGFGGAFAALADDATASYANPAGLVQLTRPEVSVEWRLWDRSPSFVAGGRLEGDPSGDGEDTVRGLLFGRDQSRSSSPSFLSAVMPRGRWSFAVYGHRLARFERTSESQGLFLDLEAAPGVTFRSPASREQVDLEVVTGGFTAAWRTTDRLRLGVGLVHSDISLAGATSLFSAPGEIFETIPLTPENLVATNDVRIDDTDWTIHAGALWSATDRLSAGFFFRQGARGDGTNVRADLVAPGGEDLRGSARFAVPDVWGLGLAYRSAGGALTLAGELDRVGYEGLLRTDLEGEEVDAREYQDAWEYHLGAEYALLHRRPILAFRAGAWVEANGDDIVEDRFTHLAVGVGLAADGFQIDVAADFSEEIDTGSVSFIYSF